MKIDPNIPHEILRMENWMAGFRDRRANRMLKQRFAQLIHFLLAKYERALAPHEKELLMALLSRAEDAQSPRQLQEVVRECRSHLDTVMQRQELQERVESLEGEIRKASPPGPVQPEPAETGKEVTLENLKGKKLLFAVMPYSAEFQDVWEGGIRRAASGTGFTPVRIDMLTKSSDITDDIVAAIKQAELLVVDVSKNNPNVMFELGYGLALKKSPVIISQATEFLTFDIQNIRTIIYQNSWQGIETLCKELQKFIKGSTKDQVKKKRKKRATDGK